MYEIYLDQDQQRREEQAEDDLQDYIAGQSDGRDLSEIEDDSAPYLQGYAEEAKKLCEEIKRKSEYLESQLQEIRSIAYRNLGRIEQLNQTQEFEEF